mgnify:CR=1 FL=1
MKLDRPAVLVVDMLNDFVTGALACDRGKAIVPAAAALLDSARAAGVPVIFCNDAHIQGIDRELELWGDHAIAGTKGAESFQITLDSKDEKITAEVLEKTAQRIYDNLKKQKYKGGIELFGIPVVKHGMSVELNSEVTPEMNGTYLVEKVEKTFSDNATYRQKVDLGGRVV